MLFLVDENLPRSITNVFQELGFKTEHVSNNPELRSQSDEDIFYYAIKNSAIIVTRDLGFANPFRFPLEKLTGLIIIRFPNEILISTLCSEIKKLVQGFKEEDFKSILVIEPGSVRKREL